MNDSFYVVWNPEHGNPRVRHAFVRGANEEAERLARINPGKEFYVLRAERVFARNDVSRTELEAERPF